MRYAIITKKTLAAMFVMVLSAVLVAVGVSQRVGVSESAATSPERLIPIYCVQTEEKKLALTFDAAWGAEDTDQLIEILQAYNAKATVFTVGEWARKYPDSVKAFHEAGHEIGNHSDSHKAYSKLNEAEITADVNACNDAVENAIGVRPVLLRAPSGDYSNDTIHAADHLSMKTIQWSVDSLDWQGLEVDEIVTRVTGAAENGSIILFHNDVKNTPKALEKILAALTQKGYSFVTVSELIYADNYKIDSTGKQISLN